MIPAGIPTVVRIVVRGSGGPEKNAIPAKEDLGGGTIGYLKNGTVVRIVDPTYPGISKYRKQYNGTTWVVFAETVTQQVKGDDIWCEETGHLVEMEEPPIEGDEYIQVWREVGTRKWEVELVKRA